MPKIMSRKLKVIFVLCCIASGVFYLEYFSYVRKTWSWINLPAHVVNGEKIEPLRILIVADPQLQGEHDEPRFLGVFTRWDADKYLKRTYTLAFNHVKPHVVIFLGDLFDEGSKAEDAEYRRYLARLKSIFDLPRKQDPSDITYVFIPGDNDVGGEARERVDRIKLKWFNQTVEDYKQVVNVQKNNLDVQFIKYHMFLDEYTSGPSYGLSHVLSEKIPSFRIILSHVSMLNFISSSVQSVLDMLNPTLILSAHSHHSTYFRMEHGSRNSIHTYVRKHFLMSGLSSTTNSHSQDDPAETVTTKPLPSEEYFHFSILPDSGTIHEISVPTCSYRMGVTDMGYGFLQLYPDGVSDYTVLWSPQRFPQLRAYLYLYILGKIIGTPWILFKLSVYLYRRYKTVKTHKGKQYHAV